MAPPTFAFVQFEFPFPLGPEDGRFVVRGAGGLPSHVLVLQTLGAAEKRNVFGRAKKARGHTAAPEPPPVAVPTTRVTLVLAEPFEDDAAATRWEQADKHAEADKALAVLGQMLHVWRAASTDPHVREVSRGQALVTRVGTGAGEQVALGKWTQAAELGDVRDKAAERRTSVTRPQERLAAVLNGRDVALACEELAIRARLDLDYGRSREAALQLRVAIEAAIAELAPWGDQLGERIAALRAERRAVGDAANEALQGGLDDDTAAEVDRILKLVEAALRARTQATGL